MKISALVEMDKKWLLDELDFYTKIIDDVNSGSLVVTQQMYSRYANHLQVYRKKLKNLEGAKNAQI